MSHQKLIDQITVALPPVQRVRVVAAQVQQDAAVTGGGKTFSEAGFLAGISEQRVRAIASGERANAEERDANMRVLPDWSGNGGQR